MWNNRVANNPAALAQALVAQCQQYLQSQPGPVTLGYSGGLDSTVFFHALLRAGAQPRLKAVHVHHGLQPLADTWLVYCQQECEQRQVEFVAVALELTGTHNIEGRARRERRAALLQHTSPEGVLALAQHQNDQAETVLLQLLRGAGPQGLSAMQPLGQYQGVELWRPLLHFRRSELEAIAKHWQLHWVEDPTNMELEPDRNYLRQHIIPQLAQRWPQLVPTLARNAQLQHEAALLQQQIAAEDWQRLATPEGGIPLTDLLRLSQERQRNLLYRWILALGMRPPGQKVLARVWSELIPAREDATPQVAWPEGVFCRHGGAVYLLPPRALAPTEHTRTITLVPENHFVWGVGKLVEGEKQGAFQPLLLSRHIQQLQLAPVPKGAKLLLRGHHVSVREVWRAKGIPSWQRLQLPGLFHQGGLIGVMGVGVSDEVCASADTEPWVLNWRWQIPKSQW